MDNKTLSILGLVLAIIFPVVGLIISAVALNKFKQSGETDGVGLAKAGLIIGIVFTAIAVISIPCAICGGVLAAMGG